MNLLLTGASGFLGVNILPLLSEKYNITTIGLTEHDDINVNLAKDVPNLYHYYEIVLHAAGKAHSTPKTKEEEQLFFEVNLQGTKNLCKALENTKIPKSFIFISTVAVYGCDFGENIDETSPLNGNTPYALSKIYAENFLKEWCLNNNVKLSILRPSLIAGPNPPGNLGSMIKGIKSGKYFNISGVNAKKSVLMVHDIANLVPLLIDKEGVYNVCDSYNPTFRELELLISSQLNKRNPISIPYWFANLLALFGDFLGNKIPINTQKLNKIAKSLTFDNSKAIRELGWIPLNVLDSFKIS